MGAAGVRRAGGRGLGAVGRGAWAVGPGACGLDRGADWTASVRPRATEPPATQRPRPARRVPAGDVRRNSGRDGGGAGRRASLAPASPWAP